MDPGNSAPWPVSGNEDLKRYFLMTVCTPGHKCCSRYIIRCSFQVILCTGVCCTFGHLTVKRSPVDNNRFYRFCINENFASLPGDDPGTGDLCEHGPFRYSAFGKGSIGKESGTLHRVPNRPVLFDAEG